MDKSIIMSFSWLKLGMSTMAAYVIYYILKVAQKPIVACNEKYANMLFKHVPMLRETYWPTIWCIEARFQTILRSLFQSKPNLPYHREVLALNDGGAVALDWLTPENSTHNIPIILILPGLTGSSSESYALHLSYQSIKQGYRSVVFNYRGNGGQELLTSRTYCATSIEDIGSIVNHINSKYPNSPILAVGISLGGIILTNYVAKADKFCGLWGCLTVSTAWNSFSTANSLEQPINNFLFNSHLCNNLKEFVIRNEEKLKSIANIESIHKCKTIRDFDTGFTSKQFGYATCADYYKDASIDSKIHDITIPLLNLNAADDPFAPLYSVPLEEARTSKHVAIVLTCRGGHIGFFDGVLVPSSTWYVERILAQFSNAIFNYRQDFA